MKDKITKDIVLPENRLAYQESGWNLSSSYEMCMDEVSKLIGGQSHVANAVAQVIGANLEMLQLKADNQKDDSSLFEPSLAEEEVMTEHSLPSIGVNYLLTELASVKYDMPRKRAQYPGAAFNYAIAIDAVAMFVGISRVEKELKEKRKELVAVRLSIPREMDAPKLEVMAPGPYVWQNCSKPSVRNPDDRRTNLWCVRPSLKRRITDLATDFGVPFSTLGEMLMVIAWEDFSRIDPYYRDRFTKEVPRIYRWLNQFRPEEAQ